MRGCAAGVRGPLSRTNRMALAHQSSNRTLKPLNIFQRVMRIWEEAHPYNAAQIMHLAGEPDIDRITEAWNETLSVSGLGVVRIVGQKFGYEKAPRQEIAVVDSDV